nr:ACT domain-containing protein [Longispora sp. (in: high G+C Gram-positive bacteria)]
RTVSASGTLTAGPREVAKLTEVDGFDVDIPAEGNVVFFRYVDRPGVVGTIGGILGTEGVNIAGMQVARLAAGGEALMTLVTDSPMSVDLIDNAAEVIGATRASGVGLDDEPSSGLAGLSR